MRVTDLLRTMDIFEALPSEELESIAQLLRERRLAETDQPTPHGRSTAADLGEALGTAAVLEVPFGGEEVSKAALTGLPLVMSRTGNPTTRAIVGLARELDQSGRELVALSR